MKGETVTEGVERGASMITCRIKMEIKVGVMVRMESIL